MSEPHDPTADTLANEVLHAGRAAWRRFLVSFVFLLVAGVGNVLFADYLWRSDLYGLKYALLVLFIILFTYLSFSFATVFFGFCSRMRGQKFGSIDAGDIEIPDELPPTAILFPVYNEDVARVMAGLRATFKNLQETGHGEAFDFFVLSDSRDPDKWVQEEVAWFTTCRDLNATGRIFYRHRRNNANKKAGNISEFLSRWGKRYRYIVIFDADSLMTGECLTKLVALMERYPQAGIIQTIPGVAEAQTAFGRAQQFASRLYGPVFSAGLNYWQQGEGNYWGHNAIIRVQPFMEHCELPDLPWREPLGGKILSHDFVEAALIRRAGYEVWLAHNLEGSYEEAPPNAVEAAQRDRRWCQGNLQHTWLLFARGFTWINRVHLLNGILSYANAFIWFWFLLISTLVVLQFKNSELTLIATPGFMRFFDVDLVTHGVIIMVLTAILLFAPKVFAVLDLLRDGERRRGFGGFLQASFGAFTETLFSALHAPVNMIWHATFIVTIPMGKSASWNAQNRSGATGLRFLDTVKIFGWMTLLGIGWAVVAWSYSTEFFAWIAPVLVPLVFSIPVAQVASSPKVGASMRRAGIWATPEERERPEILRQLDVELLHMQEVVADGELPYRQKAIVDPFVNAVHIALEDNEGEEPEREEQARAAHRRIHEQHLADLNREDFLSLLSSPSQVRAAHLALWTGPVRTSVQTAPESPIVLG